MQAVVLHALDAAVSFSRRCEFAWQKLLEILIKYTSIFNLYNIE